MSKYINYAIIGNQKITASFSKNGELLRLFYPHVDYRQFIEKLDVGVKINDSRIIYLHNDINNSYKQAYVPNTNILNTEIYNNYFNLKIVQTDFVPINENFLVKNYHFENCGDIELSIDLLLHSASFRNINNDTCGYIRNESLVQYNHDYSLCYFSREKLSSYQVNNVDNNFETRCHLWKRLRWIVSRFCDFV